MRRPKMKPLRQPWIILIIVCLYLSGCSAGSPSRKTSYPRSGKSYVIKGQRYHIMASAAGYSEKGDASWYGRPFHGRKTASGERYNMHKLTAAHKTLPLETWVKVTNLANHREVTVRVNDRGPFVRGRIIDLSYAAANELGMVRAGTAPVRVVALGAASTRKTPKKVETVRTRPRSYSEGRFAVQVASLRDRSNARTLAAELKKKFGSASIQTYDDGGVTFYRVRVGNKRTLGQAMDLQAQLERNGYRDCFVVAR